MAVERPRKHSLPGGWLRASCAEGWFGTDPRGLMPDGTRMARAAAEWYAPALVPTRPGLDPREAFASLHRRLSPT